MAVIAVYDANVLYPNTERDLLIRIAQLPHLVQAKWTENILDEVLGALRKNLPGITDAKVARLRSLMNAAVRDCLAHPAPGHSRRRAARTGSRWPGPVRCQPPRGQRLALSKRCTAELRHI